MSSDKLKTGLFAMFCARNYVDKAFITTISPLESWPEMYYVHAPGTVVFISYTSLKKCDAKRLIQTMATDFPDRTHKLTVAKGGSKQAIHFLLEHHIEFIPLSLLLFDRSQHSLVPAYRLLTPSQRDVLMHRYSTRTCDWPKIHVSDPQAIYMGAIVGDILHNMSDDIYRTVIN